MNPLEALETAVALRGGQNAFSRDLGTTQGNVWVWINKTKQIPGKWALKAEELTGISRHFFRPDLYPLENERGSRDAQ